jgi:hypothetical protein
MARASRRKPDIVMPVARIDRKDRLTRTRSAGTASLSTSGLDAMERC